MHLLKLHTFTIRKKVQTCTTECILVKALTSLSSLSLAQTLSL